MGKEPEFESSYWITRTDDGEPLLMARDAALKGKEVEFASVNPETGTLFVELKDKAGK